MTETIYHLSGQADTDQRAYAAWGEKQERERNAQIELVKTMRAAWQAYMTAARTKFTQIKVVKNSYGGDYVCLRLSRQEETSAYQVRDSISDDFVGWLNGNRLLGRVDWRYDELEAFDAQQYVNCLSPKDIWRANRYQQRID